MMMSWTLFDYEEIQPTMEKSVFYPCYSYLTCHEIEALLLPNKDAILLV